jgi:hypothetical protein
MDAGEQLADIVGADPRAHYLETVLALRSKYGVPQKSLTDAARYYDTNYLEAAGIK